MSASWSDPAALNSGASGAPEDAELVRQTTSGRREAFDELVGRHQRRAFAVAYRLLGNSHDAAEVVQDAFLKAFASLATLEDPRRFSGWFMRIVTNLSLNRRRGRRRGGQLPADDLFADDQQQANVGATTPADDPHRHLAGKELGARIHAALARLPEKQRLAIVLFTIEQLPQKEVAETLECSVEAVKWHVFQGRKRLKEMLSDLLSEGE